MQNTGPQKSSSFSSVVQSFGQSVAQIGVLAVTTLLSCSQAFAYYPTMDTGDLLKKGQYRASLEPTVVFNDLDGFNSIARIDLPANESGNIRALLGAGAVGFQTGAFYKWVPIPDFEDQPAIGILGGLVFARDEGINYLNFRFHPLVSKRFETATSGVFTPFAALPFGVTLADARTTTPLQLTFGSEWRPSGLTNVSFIGEFALNLHESYNHIALGVRVLWDDENGFKIQ